MQLDCPANVVTDSTTGALLCQDASGASVQWLVTPDFDLTQLDSGSITGYFTWGWFVIFTGWALGKGVAVFLQFLKRV